MATYTELATLSGDNILLDRISIALTIAADIIVNEEPTTTNHANRLIWAKSVFTNPGSQSKAFLASLLAANKDAQVTAINSSTDNQIQNNVNAVVDIFAVS